MWWPGRIFHKTTGLERQRPGPKLLRLQVQAGREPRQPGKTERKKNGVTCIPKQAASGAPVVAVLVIATIFPPFSIFPPNGGPLPAVHLAKGWKANNGSTSAHRGGIGGKHWLLWRVCGEWVSGRVWWTFLILKPAVLFSFLAGWDVLRGPPHPAPPISSCPSH